MNKKTIIILGSGIGDLVTANILRQQLSHEHRIVLIDRQAKYLHTPLT